MSNIKFDLLHDCGENVTPGVESEIFIVCKCDVDDTVAFPEPTPGATQGSGMRITGDIVLKAGKRFFKVNVVSDTGEVKNTKVGTYPSTSYKQSFAAKTARGKEYAEFFNENRNACMLVIVVEKDGSKRLLGHPKKGYATFGAVEEVTGMNAESTSEWTFELEASPGNVAYYYEGAIDLV